MSDELHRVKTLCCGCASESSLLSVFVCDSASRPPSPAVTVSVFTHPSSCCVRTADARVRMRAEVYKPIAENADTFFAVCRAAVHSAYGGLGFPANRSKHSSVKVDEDYAVRVLKVMSELMTYTGSLPLQLSQGEVEATVRELLTVRC